MKYFKRKHCLFFQDVFTSIDHNYKNAQYATSGETVSLWDEQRAQPLQSFKWGADSHARVKFNPIEVSLKCSKKNIPISFMIYTFI